MKRLVLAAAFLLAAIPASAQVITNPTAVQFDQSDFNGTYIDSGGLTQPIVTSFTFDYYIIGGASPLQSTPIAKSSATLVPGQAQTYQVLFSAIPSYPIGVNLQLKVHAVGTGGDSVSGLSAETFRKPVPAPAVPLNPHVR